MSVTLNGVDQAAAAFMAAPVAMLILSNRLIVGSNAAAASLFEWPRDEMVGQSVRVLYPSEFDFVTIGARWKKWLQGHHHHRDERFMKTRGGELFWAGVQGRTLTPDAPVDLTVWTIERLEEHRAAPATLTPREREIAQHIVNGRSCKEIAKMLGISHRTVEVHRGALMRKLGARNAAGLVSKIVAVR